MSVFDFTAVDSEGVEISGRMEAASELQLINRLAASGYFPSRIKEDSKRWDLSSILERAGYGDKLSRSDILLFTRQVGSLLSAGIPLTTTLSLTARQTRNSSLAELADGIRNGIEEGSTLSEAFQERRDIFSDSYISMIRAGEESGNLPSVFKRLADLMEVEAQRVSDLKSAVTYPVILILAAIAGSVFLIVGVFPTFAKIFNKASISLPWSTRYMLAIGQFARSNYLIIISAVAVLAVSAYLYLRTNGGRRRLDIVKLRLPLFGPIFLKSNLSRMANNYGALNASGIQVYRTLEIVAEAITNSVIRDAVLQVRERIKGGETIAKAFEKVGKFPPLVIHLLSIGEESGQMSEMLEKISEYYDLEVERSIRKMTKTIEPALILIMGAGVAFMYLSLITPMMQMMKVAKSGGLG
ncbi:MAG: hypothetical protein GF417_12610 [Candidatus Latescibacteria bacterium]|nr:hypothetical protein [bacterium]MBD3425270.1 hypothetical protein [Candidatus Latescibacterota bacterium]